MVASRSSHIKNCGPQRDMLKLLKALIKKLGLRDRSDNELSQLLAQYVNDTRGKETVPVELEQFARAFQLEQGLIDPPPNTTSHDVCMLFTLPMQRLYGLSEKTKHVSQLTDLRS